MREPVKVNNRRGKRGSRAGSDEVLQKSQLLNDDVCCLVILQFSCSAEVKITAEAKPNKMALSAEGRGGREEGVRRERERAGGRERGQEGERGGRR